jgi:hypothetical protein
VTGPFYVVSMAVALAALAVLALVTSKLGNRLRRIDRAARTERAAAGRLCRVVEISARGADVEDVVSSARAEIMGLFGLDQCDFEVGESATSAARLDLDSSVLGATADRADADLLLPPGGVALPVAGCGRDFGRLVLYTDRPVRFSRLEHRIAMSIANELGLTLATQPSTAE